MGLANAISGVDAPIVIRYRYEQRDQTNNFLAAIPGGIVGGTINLDNDRAVTRTCSLAFDFSSLPPTFDPLTSYIAVFAEVLVDGAFERVQLGLFRLTRPIKTEDSADPDTISFAGSDVSYLLVKGKTTATYEVTASTNYITAIETILTARGLNHDLPANVATTPIAFTWAAGATWATIVNDMLAGLNFFEIFADAEGTLRSYERQNPGVGAATIGYSSLVEPRMIVPPFRPQEQEATIPNVLLGYTNDPNRTAIFAAVSNIDPGSPTSVFATEERYAEILNDRVADSSTLADFTDYELRLMAGASESAELRTLMDPRRGNNETYDVTIEDSGALRWRVRGWTQSLAVGGEMVHRLQRAENILLGVTVG